ncbi:MAG TPA: UDP-2,4-diacetamido-2,4,6-trideoxy-beta-L-altropyranose hydrolase [Candidatus Binatia bacterium]
MATQSKTDLPPLLVRADADAVSGTGHVLRCIALAQAWSGRGGRVVFATARPSAVLSQRIRSVGASVVALEEACPAPGDLAATLSLCKQLQREEDALPWIVVDGYHFDNPYQKALRQAGRLLVIDDNAHLSDYDADIVLNHGIQAPRLNYGTARDSWLLLGTRYALLRDEFAPWRGAERTVPKKAQKILVTLGGGDSENVSAKAIGALQQFPSEEIVARIVVGPLHPYVAELKRLVEHSANIFLHTDVSELAPHMEWADIAIAGAGTTVWELAFMQVPVLLLVLAENQSAVAQGVDEFGAARSLGWARSVTVSALVDALRELKDDQSKRQRMAARGRLLVDGLGVERIIGAMAERQRFVAGGDLRIRPGRHDDALLLWQWANDPVARQNSFNSAAIAWDDHEAWFREKLASPNCRNWILEIGDLPVGQIRYDRLDGQKAAISFSVAPGFRGLQLGTELLAATMDLAALELNVPWLEGVAFKDNQASRRAFLKNGFAVIDHQFIDGQVCSIFRRARRAESTQEYFAAFH